jgi:hypothetical protein
MDELLGTRAQPERRSRSGSLCVELDEAEHFLRNRMPAPLRSEGVRVHPGMPFGFLPE